MGPSLLVSTKSSCSAEGAAIKCDDVRSDRKQLFVETPTMHHIHSTACSEGLSANFSNFWKVRNCNVRRWQPFAMRIIVLLRPSSVYVVKNRGLPFHQDCLAIWRAKESVFFVQYSGHLSCNGWVGGSRIGRLDIGYNHKKKLDAI